jgi:K+-transporting ATPase ATPase A chain
LFKRSSFLTSSPSAPESETCSANSFALALIFLQQGAPMTFGSAHSVSTLEPAAMGTAENGQPKQQTIVVGPLAGFVPMKQLGTNGGGFYEA